MCRTRPTTCALRDDHTGIHMTPGDLNTNVENYALILQREIELALQQHHKAVTE